MSRHPHRSAHDCTCPACRAAATGMARWIAGATIAAWALILAAILHFLA